MDVLAPPSLSMARCKPYSCAQGKFIPIHFAKQILPGTFEFTLIHHSSGTAQKHAAP
jgi:hypothetical protein